MTFAADGVTVTVGAVGLTGGGVLEPPPPQADNAAITPLATKKESVTLAILNPSIPGLPYPGSGTRRPLVLQEPNLPARALKSDQKWFTESPVSYPRTSTPVRKNLQESSHGIETMHLQRNTQTLRKVLIHRGPESAKRWSS